MTKKEFEKLKDVVYSARSAIEEDISNLKNHVERIETTTKGTLDVVQKTDTDGTPLCFVPRSWADTIGKIVEALDNISTSQVIIAKTLENIEKNQNKR